MLIRILRAAALLALAGFSCAACGAYSESMKPLVGHWWGHTRGLTITEDGRATEYIDSGCCIREIDLSYRLSRPRRVPGGATAAATITKVRIPNARFFGDARPAPWVGETMTLRLKDGVITDPLSVATFCASDVNSCGA
jgi:hypothetical protein